MELLAKTARRFSFRPSRSSRETQKQTIKECLALASQRLPVGEPLDWLENITPNRWKLNGKVETFN